jgi:peptide chain release factor 1
MTNKLENVILEIRPGVGGDEAELWAWQLLNMYERLANRVGWKWRKISVRRSELGGVKEAVVEVANIVRVPQRQYQWSSVSCFESGTPYNLLKHEAGVHRVQRIPKTEKRGRIHTSTATVAILPIVAEQAVNIKPNEIQTDFFRASGHGGQNVNKVETAVRLRHIPTGLMVTSQEERSQAANRERALAVLRAKLYGLQQSTINNQQSAIRSQQIGTGDRSEKIRTYNFSQDRVTDHRTQKSWGGVERVLEGDIVKIIETIKASVSIN